MCVYKLRKYRKMLEPNLLVLLFSNCYVVFLSTISNIDVTIMETYIIGFNNILLQNTVTNNLTCI